MFLISLIFFIFFRWKKEGFTYWLYFLPCSFISVISKRRGYISKWRRLHTTFAYHWHISHILHITSFTTFCIYCMFSIYCIFSIVCIFELKMFFCRLRAFRWRRARWSTWTAGPHLPSPGVPSVLLHTMFCIFCILCIFSIFYIMIVWLVSHLSLDKWLSIRNSLLAPRTSSSLVYHSSLLHTGTSSSCSSGRERDYIIWHAKRISGLPPSFLL